MKSVKIIVAAFATLLTTAGLAAAGVFGFQSFDEKENGFVQERISVCVEQQTKLELKTNQEDLQWKSKDDILTIDDEGNVTGTAVGETEVIVKKGLKKYRCTVVVTEHIFQERSCTTSETCELCGKTVAEAWGHDVGEATCKYPSVCERCGVVVQEALGHVFSKVTCTEDSVCSRCGEVNEKALGHDFAPATCETPDTCKRCGLEENEPLGHDATEETCTEPGVCKRCNKEIASALGHSFTEATCTKGSECERCKEIGKPALGHDFAEATCEQPAICKRCGQIRGKALGHEYIETDSWTDDSGKYTKYTCVYCGKEYTEFMQLPGSQSASQFAEDVLSLTNEYRAQYGLSELTMNYTLMGAAEVRGNEITVKFSHTRPDGSSCFTAFNVDYYAAGENIAAGYATPEAVVQAWMNSEGHRENILCEDFTQLAVGYVYVPNSTYKHYWVQLFIG